MKLSFALSLALAPVVLGSAIKNTYPEPRDSSGKDGSSSGKDASKDGKKSGNGGGGGYGGGYVVGSLAEIIIIWVNGGGGAETTTVNSIQTVTQTVTAGGSTTTAAAAAADTTAATTTTASTAAVAAAAAGATHTVTVGGAKGLVYEPDTIEAAVGDMVIFTFLSQNHTVSQSAFATPCEHLAGGMDSGFQPNVNNTVNPPPQVALQVMVATPLWFYCRQKGHCGKGMVFSINPNANKTQAAFQQMAIAQNGTGSASAITGGTTTAAAAAAASTTVAAAAASAPAAAPPAASSAAATTVSVAAAPAAATSSAAPPSGTGVVTGSGSVNADGSCACVVQCSFGAFPAVQAQGLGAFGGFSGALPSTAVVA